MAPPGPSLVSLQTKLEELQRNQLWCYAGFVVGIILLAVGIGVIVLLLSGVVFLAQQQEIEKLEKRIEQIQDARIINQDKIDLKKGLPSPADRFPYVNPAPAHIAPGIPVVNAGASPANKPTWDYLNAAPVHSGVVCDGCGIIPIIGNRFQSLARADFDLCQNCMNAHPYPNEQFKLMLAPSPHSPNPSNMV